MCADCTEINRKDLGFELCGDNPKAYIGNICMHTEEDYVVNTCSKPKDQVPIPIGEGIHNLLRLRPRKLNYYLEFTGKHMFSWWAIIPQSYDFPASYLPCSCGRFHPRFLGITPKSDYLRLPGQITIKRNVSIGFQHLYGVPQTPQPVTKALLYWFPLIRAPGELLVFVYTEVFLYKETMKTCL